MITQKFEDIQKFAGLVCWPDEVTGKPVPAAETTTWTAGPHGARLVFNVSTTGIPDPSPENKNRVRLILPVLVVVPPNGRVTLPAMLDRAIHQEKCGEPECMARALDCKDPEHHKTVIGGLGATYLRRADGNAAATVHPALTSAPTPPAPADRVIGREERLRARIGGTS